jgi:putative redox protein
VFTRIVMQFVVSGVKLSEPAVRRAVQMSYDKYCSATAMLAKTAEIELQVDVVDNSAAA